MKRIGVVFLASLLACLAPVSSVLCAETVGTVRDANGNPIPGARIFVRDSTGSVVGQTATDSRGWYPIKGLNLGTYTYVVDPGKGFQGGNGVAALGSQGLRVEWTVAQTAPTLPVGNERPRPAFLGGADSGSSQAPVAATGVVGQAGTVQGNDRERHDDRHDNDCDDRPLPKKCKHPRSDKD